MITLIYIAVFSILVPIVFCYLEERRLLLSIEEREKNVITPIYTIGSKINAFTIDNVKYASGSIALSMSLIRRFKISIFKFIFGPRLGYLYLVETAQREAILRMQGQYPDADYLINVKIDHCKVNSGSIEVHAYGMAVTLYPDTLGLFFSPDEKPKRNYITTIYAITRSFITNMAFFACIFLAIYFGESKLTRIVIDDFTYEDEKIIWNYLSSGDAQTYLPKHLNDSEKSIQSILDIIPKTNDILRNYNFKAHLLDSSGSKIYYLPDGNIVIEKEALRNIRTINELYFILNYAIAHYLDRSHIFNIKSNLITPYFAIRNFGNDNLITDLIIKIYPFYRVSFSKKQELKASQYALNAVYEKYGHVGGLKYLFNEPTNPQFMEYWDNSKQELLKYIQENNLPEEKPIPINLELDEPQLEIETKNILNQVNDSADLQDILNEFSLYSSANLNKYKKSMDFMNFVLSVDNLSNINKIEDQFSLLKYGQETIEFYKAQEWKVIQTYDEKISKLVAKTKDETKANVYKTLWERERSKYERLTSFYFRRDEEILNDLQGALNFLKHRLGNYRNFGGNVTFLMRNDQDSFNVISSRIQKKLNQKPPKTN